MKKKASFRLYSTVYVVAREELQLIFVPQTWVWRTLHAEGMCPHQVQRAHLRPVNLAQMLEICNWLNSNHLLQHYTLFTDEAHFSHHGINNTHNSRVVRKNPYATVELTFNYTSVCQCAVCCSGWSADWSFHLWRRWYRTAVLTISAGGIAPTFEGHAFE